MKSKSPQLVLGIALALFTTPLSSLGATADRHSDFFQHLATMIQERSDSATALEAAANVPVPEDIRTGEYHRKQQMLESPLTTESDKLEIKTNDNYQNNASAIEDPTALLPVIPVIKETIPTDISPRGQVIEEEALIQHKNIPLQTTVSIPTLVTPVDEMTSSPVPQVERILSIPTGASWDRMQSTVTLRRGHSSIIDQKLLLFPVIPGDSVAVKVGASTKEYTTIATNEDQSQRVDRTHSMTTTVSYRATEGDTTYDVTIALVHPGQYTNVFQHVTDDEQVTSKGIEALQRYHESTKTPVNFYSYLADHHLYLVKSFYESQAEDALTQVSVAASTTHDTDLFVTVRSNHAEQGRLYALAIAKLTELSDYRY